MLTLIMIGCSSKSDLPSNFVDDQENFKQSIILLNEARDLSNPPESRYQTSFKLSEKTEKEINSKTEKGLSLGKQVGNDYLDYLHPELRNHFHNKLIKGTEIYYQGLRSNESANISEGSQMAGIMLVMEWLAWWEKHGKEIADKVYGDS